MDWGDLAIAALAVVLVFLGAALTILIELARGQLERKQRRHDRRDDFQRETLIELQDSLYRLVLGFNLIAENIQRDWAGEAKRVWEAYGDPGVMTQEAGPRVAVLVECVNDDRLRELVNELRTGYTLVFPNSKSDSEAITHLKTIHQIQLQANTRIGKLLRSL